MIKLIRIFLSIIFLCFAHLCYAANVKSVSFFASNNVEIINSQQAYERLLSEAQNKLKDTLIDIMQSNHMEQNKCEDSLGLYQMANSGMVTADNTKIFTTSPYQIISDDQVFAMATEMAILLKQESVAVFIPDEQANTSDTIIHLKSHAYHLAETLKLINEQLPHEYAQAFSLHFNNKNGGIENATLSSIEWLGKNIDPTLIQKVFPREELILKHGKAFLIFKNGQRQEI